MGPVSGRPGLERIGPEDPLLLVGRKPQREVASKRKPFHGKETFAPTPEGHPLPSKVTHANDASPDSDGASVQPCRALALRE